MVENIYLYFTSDIHSHFENWPKIAHFLKQRKQNHEQKKESYFLFDNGDHIDRFHPITEASLGKSNVELLNHGGYHAVTIGNNEGITLPSESFHTLYKDASFEVVCANIHPVEKKTPNWLKPYTILETKSGLKVGVMGLTAPFNAFYQPLGWNAISPYDALDTFLPTLSSQSDIVILLSHLGFSEDEYISNNYNNIDFIVGGHTHHLLKDGEMVKDTLLGAVGKHGFYVGEACIEWDHSQKRIITKSAKAMDLTNAPEDEEVLSLLNKYEGQAHQILDEKIISLKDPLKVNWFKESALMTDLTDLLREWTKADCAMLNAGVLLEDLPMGDITREDIHRICPHPINPATVSIVGDQLLETLRMVHTKSFMEYELKGFGFRGKQIGKMIFSNIVLKTKKGHDGEERILHVLINNEPLDLNKVYTLATADTFTFGTLLPSVSRAKDKKYFLPEFLRDLLTYSLIRRNG
ncbi:bifunctional metallophosphatase/5'-nucleotidase [Salirhabdus sp. Marseille-P4669]|uniref:bifunctional metallophosphatase/5'-nucleotidase n=1 Tax=Salirhabdus sp. Marseille-P4669 TaxID=2042310 RepID=UPI000C7C9B2E|nr:bifunctional UDP-sugar hydrolase/5'-nucleotidase [Salirhabdus sp. Marseille-P4669]